MKSKVGLEMRDTKYETGLSSNKTNSRLTSSQLHQLESFGDKINKFGLNFAVCNTDGELILMREGGKFKSDERLIIEGCSSILEKGIEDNQSYRLLILRHDELAWDA